VRGRDDQLQHASHIDRSGGAAKGSARPRWLIFIPYALAHETIIAEVDGARGTLVEWCPEPGPDRPFAAISRGVAAARANAERGVLCPVEA